MRAKSAAMPPGMSMARLGKPSRSAEMRASSLSSNGVPGNAAVNDCRRLKPIAASRQAIADESMPDDRKSPSGRSATVRIRIAASNVASHGSADGLGPPVFVRRNRPLGEIVMEVMRGRQPRHGVEHRARRGYRPVREIGVDACGREAARGARQPRQQRAHRRGEREAVVAMRVDHGLETEAVADEVDRAARRDRRSRSRTSRAAGARNRCPSARTRAG